MNSKIIIIKKDRIKKKNIICPVLLKLSVPIILNKLYLNIAFRGDKEAKKHIRKKLNSYCMQDKKNDKYDREKIIVYEQLIEKMVGSKMKCYYCRCPLFLFYTTIREPSQWTLDRIDNTKGHNNDNVVIACLKCNLERRRRDDKKFLFSKQMKIIKIN